MIYEYLKIINSEKFSKELALTSIHALYNGMVFDGLKSGIHFTQALTEPQKQILDDLVNNHSSIDTDLVVKISIQDRKKYGEQLIEDFKLKNLSDGIQWFQAVHLHSRVRAWQVNYPAPIGGSDTVDIFNMILSGDIETASLSLLYGVNDEMTLPTHWITNERRLWLINQMRIWLGWPTV